MGDRNQAADGDNGGMRVTDTLAFVRGGWQLDRHLTDYRTGAEGWFTGRALVAPAPPGQAGAAGAAGAAGRMVLHRGR